MYNLIIENKWLILLVFEFFAWSATIFMFYARYRMQSQFWFRVATVIGVFTGVIPQVLLGIVNYVENKEFDMFTSVIVLLIVYGLTVGKKHFQNLDVWAQKRFSRN